MKQGPTSTDISRLPGYVRSLFWDYDANALDWQTDRDLIIRRVLTVGGWEAVTWLRAQLGDTALRDWLIHRRGAGLSPRQLRFWELILRLPEDEVTAWLAGAERAVWDKRMRRYPLLQPLVEGSPFGCSLASLDDLACMKLSAIAQRGARKDFVDLYVLGAGHKPLPALLDLYRQKYAMEDIAHLLYALVYVEDAEREPMPRLWWDFDWQTVKETVRAWVRQVAG